MKKETLGLMGGSLNRESLIVARANKTRYSLIDFSRRQNMHGWNFGLQENSTSYFGGVVDAGGAYINKKTTLSQGGGICLQ
jgi:hypothetical protein